MITTASAIFPHAPVGSRGLKNCSNGDVWVRSVGASAHDPNWYVSTTGSGTVTVASRGRSLTTEAQLLQVMWSYDTVVAEVYQGVGVGSVLVATAEKYSVTTSRHMTQVLPWGAVYVHSALDRTSWEDRRHQHAICTQQAFDAVFTRRSPRTVLRQAAEAAAMGQAWEQIVRVLRVEPLPELTLPAAEALDAFQVKLAGWVLRGELEAGAPEIRWLRGVCGGERHRGPSADASEFTG